MEYDILYNMLPTEPKTWTVTEVGKWLQFIGLDNTFPLFRHAAVDGSCLDIIVDQDLQDIGIDSNIKRKKIMQWVQIGLKEYSKYLNFKKKNNSQTNTNKQLPNTHFIHIPNNLEQSHQINYDSKILDERSSFHEIKRQDLVPSLYQVRTSKPSQPNGSITEEQLAAQLKREPNYILLGQSFASPGGTMNPAMKNPVEEDYQYKNKAQSRPNGRRIFENTQNTQAVSSQPEDTQGVPHFGTAKSEEKPKQRFEKVEVTLLQNSMGRVQTTAPIILNAENSSIGRSPDCQIQISNENVSRVHAWILKKDGVFHIQDRGSQSGTYIFLGGRTLIKKGFIIQMGSYDFLVKSVDVDGKDCTVTLNSQAGNFTFSLVHNETVMIFGKQNVPTLANDQCLNIMHAQWSYGDEGLIVEDLDSTYGTWVRLSLMNTQSMLFPIANQRIIRIGDHIYQVNPC